MPKKNAKLLAALAASSLLVLACVGSPAFAQTWETQAPMPGGGRAAAGVGTLNGLLYAVGGFSNLFDSHSVVSTVEAYDPVLDTWSTKAPLTSARRSAGVAAVGGLLYVVGGDVVEDPLATVEAYDPATNSWSAKAPMPTPRESLAVAVVNNILYAIGGRGPGFGPRLATVEAYDPATNTWATKASMPTPRQGAAAAVLDGIIYVTGGDDFPAAGGHVVYATVEAYDRELAMRRDNYIRTFNELTLLLCG